jgi:hypothetical protein
MIMEDKPIAKRDRMPKENMGRYGVGETGISA